MLFTNVYFSNKSLGNLERVNGGPPFLLILRITVCLYFYFTKISYISG